MKPLNTSCLTTRLLAIISEIQNNCNRTTSTYSSFVFKILCNKVRSFYIQDSVKCDLQNFKKLSAHLLTKISSCIILYIRHIQSKHFYWDMFFETMVYLKNEMYCGIFLALKWLKSGRKKSRAIILLYSLMKGQEVLK